jgi:hypothetical protein
VNARFNFSGFFDREAVVRAVGRAKTKILNETGRLIRKRAQASIKYEDGPSRPGEPPHGHKSGQRKTVSKSTGRVRHRAVSFLREFLFYKFDPATESVVVGPEKLGSTIDSRALPALEYGGSATISDRGKRKTVRIKERPFMGPALKAELPGFLNMWKDSVK